MLKDIGIVLVCLYGFIYGAVYLVEGVTWLFKNYTA